MLWPGWSPAGGPCRTQPLPLGGRSEATEPLDESFGSARGQIQPDTQAAEDQLRGALPALAWQPK